MCIDRVDFVWHSGGLWNSSRWICFDAAASTASRYEAAAPGGARVVRATGPTIEEIVSPQRAKRHQFIFGAASGAAEFVPFQGEKWQLSTLRLSGEYHLLSSDPDEPANSRARLHSSPGDSPESRIQGLATL